MDAGFFGGVYILDLAEGVYSAFFALWICGFLVIPKGILGRLQLYGFVDFL